MHEKYMSQFEKGGAKCVKRCQLCHVSHGYLLNNNGLEQAPVPGAVLRNW